jgi:hypothetical protein
MSFAHGWQTYRTMSTVGFISHPFLTHANFFYVPSQVTVPFDGIHRQVKVCVKNQWFV